MLSTPPKLDRQQAQAHWMRLGILKRGTAKTLAEFKVFNRHWALEYTREGWCDLNLNGGLLTHTFTCYKKMWPNGINCRVLILGNFKLQWGVVGQEPTYEVQQ